MSFTSASGTPSLSFRNRPFRFKVGIGLLVLYPLMWLFAVVVPFLPLEAGAKTAVIAGDLAAAEVIGLVGIACVGKETYQALRARFRRKRRGTAPEEG